jgi:hypothetical protein
VLSHADNELLARLGPATSMRKLLRQGKRCGIRILPNEVDWITAPRDWHAATTTEVV